MNTFDLMNIAFLPLERRKDSPTRTAVSSAIPEPQQPRNRNSFAPVEGSSPCADARTASVGDLYPVTCEPRYYDAASKILEDEPHLFSHDNANELGALIQQWISDARDNWEPR